jgi:hypothetical protein
MLLLAAGYTITSEHQPCPCSIGADRLNQAGEVQSLVNDPPFRRISRLPNTVPTAPQQTFFKLTPHWMNTLVHQDARGYHSGGSLRSRPGMPARTRHKRTVKHQHPSFLPVFGPRLIWYMPLQTAPAYMHHVSF